MAAREDVHIAFTRCPRPVPAGLALKLQRRNSGGGATNWGGRMAGAVSTTGAVMCGPGYEYLLLADRVRSCLLHVDAVIDRLQVAETLEWQSPAAEALRQCLAEQKRQLYLMRADFGPAEKLLKQHAEAVAAETAAAEAAGFPAPGRLWEP